MTATWLCKVRLSVAECVFPLSQTPDCAFSSRCRPGGAGPTARQAAGYPGKWTNWANALEQPPARLRGGLRQGPKTSLWSLTSRKSAFWDVALTERRTLTPGASRKRRGGVCPASGLRNTLFHKTRDVSHQDAGRRDANPQHVDSDAARRHPATQRTTQLKGTLLRIPSPPLKPPLKHDSHWYVTTHATGARSSLSHTRHPYANSISPSTIAAISHVPSPPPEGTPLLEHG